MQRTTKPQIRYDDRVYADTHSYSEQWTHTNCNRTSAAWLTFPILSSIYSSIDAISIFFRKSWSKAFFGCNLGFQAIKLKIVKENRNFFCNALSYSPIQFYSVCNWVNGRNFINIWLETRTSHIWLALQCEKLIQSHTIFLKWECVIDDLHKIRRAPVNLYLI